jgi:hypothetical protein
MIINIARESQFAEELAQALETDISLKAAAGEAREDSVIVADLSGELSEQHKNVIQSGMDNCSTFVLRNCRSKEMAKFAFLSVDASTVVMKSGPYGRTQDIIVLSDTDGPTMEPSVIADAILEPPKDSGQMDALLAKGARLPSVKPEVEEERVAVPVKTSHEAERSEADVLARMIQGLNDRSLMIRATSPDFNVINASQVSARLIFAELKWTTEGGGIADIFGSFNIELAAVLEPIKSKYIKVTSVGTGISANPAWNSARNRGYFTSNARVLCYPGRDHAPSKASLPIGWRRIAIAPETSNSTETYTRTTGWSIGVKGGGKVAEKPEISAELSASYSSSESYTETIKDFQVKNLSSAAVCEWHYEYTKMARSWTSLFNWPAPFRYIVIDRLPDLCTSTMFLKNEAIYEAPAEAQGTQQFVFYIEQTTARLWDTGDWRKANCHCSTIRNGMWRDIDVNLGMVRHP